MKLLKRITRELQRLYAKLNLNNKHYCVICDRGLSSFLPFRGGSKHRSPLMKALDVIGSDVDNFSCPHCGSHDRERHLFLYMDALGMIKKLSGKKVLHFAPERQLSKKIAEMAPEIYIKADLFPTSDDIQNVDLLEISFDNDCFDFIICNHVLEHVDDFEQALQEIRRVLKTGGRAILQVPYSAKLKNTFSDVGIDNPEARKLAYGQEDHVRLFGSNVFEVFESAGLARDVKYHNDFLADIDASKYGVNAREPFFLFLKY